MSEELVSAIRGTGVGFVIGLGFGAATLNTIGFDRMTIFEGVLLTACAVFGGSMFGALIGSTGAFRSKSAAPVEQSKKAIA